MARQNSQKTVSLFPFLAVLVCTMGALILLLLVTTRRIRQDSHQSADQSRPADAPQIFEELDRLSHTQNAFPSLIVPADDFPFGPDSHRVPVAKAITAEPTIHLAQIETLPDLREQQQQAEQLRLELAQETADLHELQIDIAETKKRLRNSLKDEHHIDSLQLAALQQQQELLSHELSAKGARLADLQAELEKRSKTTQDAESLLRDRKSDLVSLREYVRQAESAPGSDATIVDFTNSSGTQRSPIIIDVTESGFEFLPAGITVTTENMSGFPANDNPLLAAVMALHDHRLHNSLTTKPYVLLLVRPSGSLEFYAAQRTLSEAGIHFGYELVEKDRKIAAGVLAPEEAQCIAVSIDNALQRRERLYGSVAAAIDSITPEKKRGIRVMPDGRVLFADDDNEGLDGRYYAGGEAPRKMTPELFPAAADKSPGQTTPPANEKNPASSAEPDRRLPNYEQTNDDEKFVSSRPSPLPAEDTHASNPWQDGNWDEAINAHEQQRDQTAIGKKTSQIEPDFSAADFAGNADDSGIPVIVSGPQEQPDTTSTGKSEPSNSLFANKFPELTGIDSADVADLDPPAILGRPGAISGNLGVGGGGSFDVRSKESDPTNAMVAQQTAQAFKPATPDGRASHALTSGLTDLDGGPQNEDVADEPVQQALDSMPQENISASEASRTDSLERFDWPAAAPSVAAQDSRTVEPPENPFFAISPQSGNPSSNSGTQAASDSQMYLQNAAQQHQARSNPDSPTANPMLKSMLTSAMANDPKLAGYYPVKIHIEKNSLEVGSFEPIDTSEWTPDQVIELALEALAAEIQLLPKDQQDSTIPAIDYVVGPGAARLQHQIASTLLKMKVPTRTTINVAGQTMPGTPLKGQQHELAEPMRQSRPLSQPANPIDVPEPRHNGQRLSI